MKKDPYSNYSFKVDGGLNVCSRAKTEKEAYARIQAAWPRGTIELVGVDLDSAERNVRPMPTKTKVIAPKKNRRKVLATDIGSIDRDGHDNRVENELGLDETEASLVANFVH